MSGTGSFDAVVGENDSFPSFSLLLVAVLAVTYSVARGASVLRDLVVPSDVASTSASATSPETAGILLNDFGSLAGNLLAGAPTFVLLLVALAGLVVFRGGSLLRGTALSVALTAGVFVAVGSPSGDERFVFLVASAAALGVLSGGIGALFGAGVRFARE